MSENDAKKNKHRFKDIEKASRESNEQQVLTVAAFCFAIVSWMATARGLQAYVFSGGAEATLISFGVQSILFVFNLRLATVYKGNIIKNLIMDCQSYTKYRPNETTGGIFVSWRRKEELPTGA